MSDKPELLPCPFCGDDAEYELDDHWQDKYVVECGDCGCSRRSEYGWGAVASEWNTRHTPSGYKLVPVEPTTEMRQAWRDNKDEPLISAPDKQWAAMLEAAP